MKKTLFLLMAIFAFALSANSQSALRKSGLGLNVGYSGFNENAGMGVHYRMHLAKNFRFEPSFNYYFKKDQLSLWDLMANFHYVIPVANKIGIYPLAGIGMAQHKIPGESELNFSMVFGGGLEVPVSSDFSLGVELKGQYISWDVLEDNVKFVPTFKATYLF